MTAFTNLEPRTIMGVGIYHCIYLMLLFEGVSYCLLEYTRDNLLVFFLNIPTESRAYPRRFSWYRYRTQSLISTGLSTSTSPSPDVHVCLFTASCSRRTAVTWSASTDFRSHIASTSCCVSKFEDWPFFLISGKRRATYRYNVYMHTLHIKQLLVG